ncbi:hypothetical protein PISMIDRAFT_673110 [Pisolithus microcarpus 441]|uniref:Uncharacterized protein n=1 Tax=Pisolithus microcarpus 441 TaxID=765257 RepID=A0A0C9ZS16_9AGAM|nr:hypothetical protein PISMIDRAFT_673110 [Pisolithus microcarpus 441]
MCKDLEYCHSQVRRENLRSSVINLDIPEQYTCQQAPRVPFPTGKLRPVNMGLPALMEMGHAKTRPW